MTQLTLDDAQKLVDNWIKTKGVRYFNELTNMTLLVEEVGELATALRRVADDSRRPSPGGAAMALDEAIAAHRPALREELADLLAHLLRLANDTGIDLEQAYLDKMRLQLAAAPGGEMAHGN